MHLQLGAETGAGISPPRATYFLSRQKVGKELPPAAPPSASLRVPCAAQALRARAKLPPLRSGQTVAVLLRSCSEGYAGTLELLIAIDANGKLLGVKTLEQRETPGLGGDIGDWPNAWLRSFTGQSRSEPTDAGWALKKDQGQFDQIAGDNEIPVKKFNFFSDIPDSGLGALETFCGPVNADIIPHETADFVPIVVDDDQFVSVNRIAATPVGNFSGSIGFQVSSINCILILLDMLAGVMGNHDRFQETVAGETIGAVQAGTGDLADRV